MIAAEALGANKARLIKYANSGDVSYGDKSSVVGYASIVFYKENQKKSENEQEFTLTKEEQSELLRIAKNAVEKKVENGKTFQVSEEKYQSLLKDRGAFVTLKINGQLRGCIGYTSPVQPLYETVRDVAISAATRDPRFRPVQKDELSKLSYEISVLSPMRRVIDINTITIGRDGLMIKKGIFEGLLLPQVAPEQGWDRTQLLEHTCQKAGLPPNAWKDKDTDIFAFTAFVFGEKE
jgi:AmmeMemoRadiSam system protein A